ncbi:hypothetical protein KAW18_14275 [candidate division WOR-3 bacterium]|nr:hypothetical protein [candidate division WOR-3 bacterium]
MKPISNYVLILLEKEFNDKLVLESGKELYLEVSFETAKHTSVIGTVVKMPDKLIYGHGRLDMKWKCWMELEKGDMVWMNWDAIITAMRSAEQKIEIGGKLHLLIPYSQLFLALRIISNAKEIYSIWKNVDKLTKYKTNMLTRNKTTYEVIMLNGYCLVEPIKIKDLFPELLPVEFLSSGVKIPDTVRDTFSDSYGMVTYCGVPNKEYVEKYMDDKAKVNPGDIIRFEKSADIFLEYPLHAKLTDDKALFYRMQRHLMTVQIT